MIRFLLTISIALGAFAQPATPVLIPVYYNGPGAFGSQWYTQVSINNFTSQVVEGRGVTFVSRACPIPEGCARTRLAAGDFGTVGGQNMFDPGPNWGTGFLLYIPSNEALDFELDARFGEKTRNQYGVEMPIARETDFRRAPVVLPYVAWIGHGNELRTTLRVYSPDAVDGQQVRVEIYYPDVRVSPTPLATATLTLALSDPPGKEAPVRPAYAQIDLQSRFPGFFTGTARVEVVPLQKGGVTPRVWAIATAVRNDTNEVAMFSPRH